MRRNSELRVIVIGAGIGGLTTALALRRFGINVEVYEGATRQRSSGAALGVGSNATKVLRELGINLENSGLGQVTSRFELLDSQGGLIRRVPMESMTQELGAPLVSILRNDLTGLLHEELGDCMVKYGSKLARYEVADDGVVAFFEDGSVVSGDVLIGADGMHSAVRRQIVGHESVIHHGYVCWLATVSFAHQQLSPGFAGHYWGNGKRFGLIDIGNGSAYWWATKNVADGYVPDPASVKAEVLSAFGGWADEVVAVVKATPGDEILTVPAWDRPHLNDWGDGSVTLVGDAAHPMLASLAQGAGSSIEDGFVVASALAHFNEVVPALRAYEDARRDRTRMLVSTSRAVSRIEQMENHVVCSVRNAALRYMPESLLKKQNMAPMAFDFPEW